MKRTLSRLFRSGAAGLLALLLFAGGNAPALADSCIDLSENVWTSPIPEAARKPTDVSVSQNADGNLFTLTWSIAASFPTDVLTGFCTEQTHPDSGDEEEECYSDPNKRSALANLCYPDPAGNFSSNHCYGGTHKFRVKITTSCEQGLPWSDAVEIESTWEG